MVSWEGVLSRYGDKDPGGVLPYRGFIHVGIPKGFGF